MILVFISACTSRPDRVDDNNDFGAVYEVDLTRFFEGIDSNDATFVVLEGQGEKNSTRYNSARAAQRFIPASTFKIPNTIIALELGIADNKDFTLHYDSLAHRGEGFWASVWSQDHTLQSAINHSVYWYYQELARRAGEEQIRSFLEKFDYGNRNMDGGVDRFWLHGGLRVSPDEQVRFLKRFYFGELGISDHSTAILKEIIILEETEEYRISGKTGTAAITPERELIWLVGYIENEAGVWFYALNLEGDSAWELWGARSDRIALVRELMNYLGFLSTYNQ